LGHAGQLVVDRRVRRRSIDTMVGPRRKSARGVVWPRPPLAVLRRCDRQEPSTSRSFGHRRQLLEAGASLHRASAPRAVPGVRSCGAAGGLPAGARGPRTAAAPGARHVVPGLAPEDPRARSSALPMPEMPSRDRRRAPRCRRAAALRRDGHRPRLLALRRLGPVGARGPSPHQRLGRARCALADARAMARRRRAGAALSRRTSMAGLVPPATAGRAGRPDA
jgi:hypothetical protein